MKTGITDEPGYDRPWWKKLAWMIALWLAGAMSLGTAAFALRFLMHAVGLVA